MRKKEWLMGLLFGVFIIVFLTCTVVWQINKEKQIQIVAVTRLNEQEREWYNSFYIVKEEKSFSVYDYQENLLYRCLDQVTSYEVFQQNYLIQEVRIYHRFYCHLVYK